MHDNGAYYVTLMPLLRDAISADLLRQTGPGSDGYIECANLARAAYTAIGLAGFSIVPTEWAREAAVNDNAR